MTSKRKLLFFMVSIMLVVLAILFISIYRKKICMIMTPFLIAGIITYIAKPMVLKLERRDVPKGVGVILVYSGFIIVFGAAAIFIIPEIIENARELMDTLPEIISGYQGILGRLVSYIHTSRWPGEIREMMLSQIEYMGLAIQGAIAVSLKKSFSLFTATAEIFLETVLGMVIAYYFIVDGEFFKEIILSLPPRGWRKGIISVLGDINRVLSGFIQGQLIVALIVGLLEMAGLLVLKVKYAFILGIVGGLANTIPYFGPVIGSVPAIAIALVESPGKAIWIALLFIAAQQIDNALISPGIIKEKLGLHPVITIFAVFAGGKFFGIPGMFLAVPVFAIVRVLMKRAVNALV